jgi:hypothetical protein
VDIWTKTFSSPVPIAGAQSCTAVNRTEIQMVLGLPQTVSVFDHYDCVVKTTETCDAGSTAAGPINNAVCTDCQLNTTTTTTPRSNPLIISYDPVNPTRPQGLPINNYQWIVGNNVPVFENGDSFAITSPFPTILAGHDAKISNISPLIQPNGSVTTAF